MERHIKNTFLTRVKCEKNKESFTNRQSISNSRQGPFLKWHFYNFSFRKANDHQIANQILTVFNFLSPLYLWLLTLITKVHQHK